MTMDDMTIRNISNMIFALSEELNIPYDAVEDKLSSSKLGDSYMFQNLDLPYLMLVGCLQEKDKKF